MNISTAHCWPETGECGDFAVGGKPVIGDGTRVAVHAGTFDLARQEREVDIRGAVGDTRRPPERS